jgi:hypothetical protein
MAPAGFRCVHLETCTGRIVSSEIQKRKKQVAKAPAPAAPAPAKPAPAAKPAAPKAAAPAAAKPTVLVAAKPAPPKAPTKPQRPRLGTACCCSATRAPPWRCVGDASD